MGREWGLKFQVRAGGEEWVAGKLQNLGGIPGNKGALKTKVKAFPKTMSSKKKKKKKESWSNTSMGSFVVW